MRSICPNTRSRWPGENSRAQTSSPVQKISIPDRARAQNLQDNSRAVRRKSDRGWDRRCNSSGKPEAASPSVRSRTQCRISTCIRARSGRSPRMSSNKIARSSTPMASRCASLVGERASRLGIEAAINFIGAEPHAEAHTQRPATLRQTAKLALHVRRMRFAPAAAEKRIRLGRIIIEAIAMRREECDRVAPRLPAPGFAVKSFDQSEQWGHAGSGVSGTVT